MAKTRSAIISLLKTWLGYSEANGKHKYIIDTYNSQRPLPRNYAVKYSDEWCATTVSALAVKLGYTDIIPTECSCGKMVEKAKAMGIWVENDAYVPNTGDIIMYDWQDNGVGDNTGWPDHVGMVETVSGNTITVIEGNNNCSVARRNIAVNGKYIRGFITPKYDAEPKAPAANTGSSSKKPVDVIAREVINGAWGSGNDRKTRLINAGYNYAEVQARVNQILSNKTTTVDYTKVAKDVIAGKYGNGAQRKENLAKAGYDYAKVQAEVNKLLK